MRTQEDLIEVIGKLMNQAEHAATDAERETFMAQAMFLGSKHSIDAAKAQAALAKTMKREEAVMDTITIGQPKTHNLAVFCELFMTIGRAYDIKFNIAHNSTYVIAFGMPSDIEVVKALYTSLVQQMMTEVMTFIKLGEWKSETDVRYNRRTGEYVRKPIDSRVAKRNFYEAFSSEIGTRVRAAQRQAKEAAIAEDEEAREDMTTAAELEVAESTSTELVIVKKREEVDEFYKNRSTARGSWKGSQSTYRSNTGRSAGRSAGQRASLTSGRALGGGRKAIG